MVCRRVEGQISPPALKFSGPALRHGRKAAPSMRPARLRLRTL